MEYQDRWIMAVDRYNRLFDNDVYNRATDGHSLEYANTLIDAAMTICGCPYAAQRVQSVDCPTDVDGWEFLYLFA